MLTISGIQKYVYVVGMFRNLADGILCKVLKICHFSNLVFCLFFFFSTRELLSPSIFIKSFLKLLPIFLFPFYFKQLKREVEIEKIKDQSSSTGYRLHLTFKNYVPDFLFFFLIFFLNCLASVAYVRLEILSLNISSLHTREAVAADPKCDVSLGYTASSMPV